MKIKQPLTLCGEKLNTSLHICAFFDSREEQYAVILPYIKEGLGNNERVINILESVSHQEHYDRLSDVGIPVKEMIANEQLKVLHSDDTYLEGGTFAAEKMYNKVEQALIEAEDAGYDRVRTYGEMGWALRSLPGRDELLEYEARINLLTPKHNCSLVCVYDISKFGEKVMADVLSTHPYVILKGKINKNPHYIQPDKILSTLNGSRKRGSESEPT